MFYPNNGRPLFEQLRTIISQQIADGTFKEGDRLPSERKLSEQYKISRITVRQALTDLVNDGVLTRLRRRGTFVAGKKIANSLGMLQGVTEELSSQHLDIHVSVVEKKIIAPHKKILNKLDLMDGAKVLKITRLIRTEGLPLGIDYSYLPVTISYLLEGFDPPEDAVYKILELYGYRISWARQTIHASNPTQPEAEMLEIDASSPVLAIERITYLEGDIPIIYSETIYCPDRYQYDVILSRNPGITDRDFPQK